MNLSILNNLKTYMSTAASRKQSMIIQPDQKSLKWLGLLELGLLDKRHVQKRKRRNSQFYKSALKRNSLIAMILEMANPARMGQMQQVMVICWVHLKKVTTRKIFHKIFQRKEFKRHKKSFKQKMMNLTLEFTFTKLSESKSMNMKTKSWNSDAQLLKILTWLIGISMMFIKN